jgi:hypothetical protein
MEVPHLELLKILRLFVEAMASKPKTNRKECKITCSNEMPWVNAVTITESIQSGTEILLINQWDYLFQI